VPRQRDRVSARVPQHAHRLRAAGGRRALHRGRGQLGLRELAAAARLGLQPRLRGWVVRHARAPRGTASMKFLRDLAHAIERRPWLRGFIVAFPVALVAIALLWWAIHVRTSWFERHTLVNYCVVNDAERRVIAGTRSFARYLAGFLLLICAPLLARWASRRTLRQIVTQLTIMLVSVMAALVFSELVLERRE